MPIPIQLQRLGGQGVRCRTASRIRRITPTTLPHRPSCQRPSHLFVAKWLNRDPIGEDGGLNLHGFVNNDPVTEFDAFGLFLSGTHRRLTREALDASGVKLSEKCKDKIYNVLADANTGQDHGAAFDALERHFNRPYHKLETWNEVVSRRKAWDGKFSAYVSSEVQAFGQSLSGSPANCKGALEALGRASHSWQDFYAHAISSAHTPFHKKLVGFQAWTLGYGGSPDYHPQLWPSSYNSPYAWDEGEHPNRHEPVSGHEAQLRESAAASFVAGKYGTLFQQWLKACPCWCDSSK